MMLNKKLQSLENMREQNTKVQEKEKKQNKNYKMIPTPVSPHPHPNINHPPQTYPIPPSFIIAIQ